ncbi:MAG: AraC family transcriptional regulator [Gammaproteobacteria bacterium]|nr:MAG: AraC family transcriptional regulator [Gammaproteobacteria bacterium]
MKRSVLGFAFTADALRRFFRVPVDDVLAPFGLSLAHLDPDAGLERSFELKLLEALLAHVRDPVAGFKLGGRFTLPGYGPFAMLLMSCPNAFEACKVGIHYQSLAYLFGDLSFDLGPEESAIDLKPWKLPPKVARFIMDRDIAGTLKLMDDIARLYDQPVTLKTLWMPYPRPEEAAFYESQVPAPIVWGQDRARLVADTREFARTFDRANPVAYRFYKRICDQLIEAPDEKSAPLSSHILDYLRLFSGQFPDIRATAHFLDIPERTLRRRLREEGTSFRTLLDTVRRDRAKHLLASGNLTMDQVARELGYSETAALYRAMRRWDVSRG